MSKDLKNLIDSVEKKALSRTELEQKFQKKKEEVKRLKFTLKEQKLLIEDLKSQVKDEEVDQDELPSEVQILKDIIISQRKNLIRRDNNINDLNKEIDELTVLLENEEKIDFREKNNEELISAQKLLLQLTDENEEYKNQIKHLQAKLDEMQYNERKVDNIEDENIQIEENEELVNIKRLNFQLMEENGTLRVEIESLKTEVQEGIEEATLEELKLANDKIKILTLELEDYEAQVKYLQNRLEKDSQPLESNRDDISEFNRMKDELLEYQRQNLVLNDMVIDLKEDNLDEESMEEINTSEFYTIPKLIPLSLFNRIYNLLDNRQKGIVKNILIKDLKSEYNEVKINAVKILSQIKDAKIYDAFLEMIHDKNWMVRLYIIKALSKFESKYDELIDLMKELSRDLDVDVRELAIKVLYNITTD
ncbi:hypothetical protein LCGC14_1038640 [marine sediment metagenome]|uniref:HEAT repeat domain-containing protein n=1 Tax=marine sediment metagenome TaxID=412755 RepID=A0A0F9QAN5_9ZZZZ